MDLLPAWVDTPAWVDPPAWVDLPGWEDLLAHRQCDSRRRRLAVPADPLVSPSAGPRPFLVIDRFADEKPVMPNLLQEWVVLLLQACRCLLLVSS